MGCLVNGDFLALPGGWELGCGPGGDLPFASTADVLCCKPSVFLALVSN